VAVLACAALEDTLKRFGSLDGRPCREQGAPGGRRCP
jgi:hypothetical protein